MRSAVRLCIALAALVCLAPSVYAQGIWTVRQLYNPYLPNNTAAYRINDAGTVVGEYFSGTSHTGVYWGDPTAQNLVIPIPLDSGYSETGSIVFGINPGTGGTTNFMAGKAFYGLNGQRAVWWVIGSTWTENQLPYPPAEAHGIDDEQTTAGFLLGTGGGTVDVPFVNFVGDGWVELQGLGSISGRAYDAASNINTVTSSRLRWNQVVGYAATTSGTVHAAVWQRMRAQVWGIRDLGTIRKKSLSAAYAINVFGQIVGESGNALVGSGNEQSGGDAQAVTWNAKGTMTVLPVPVDILSSVATGVNYHGDIVGWGYNNAGFRVGLLWVKPQKGSYTSAAKLENFSGATECKAMGVNIFRNVVGYCLAPHQTPSTYAVVWGAP